MVAKSSWCFAIEGHVATGCVDGGDASNGPEVPVLQDFIPPWATRVVVYLKPISMRWGAVKLRELCTETLGIEPATSTLFLFTNKSRDCLLMYFAEPASDQTLTKKLNKGVFLLPAPEHEGVPYVIMKPSIVPRLFRS